MTKHTTEESRGNPEYKKAEEIRNTGKRRSVVLLNSDNKKNECILSVLVVFFGQVIS